MADLREIVGPHQPAETGAWKAAAQRCQRIGGKTRCQRALDIGDDQARMLGLSHRAGQAL